MAPILTGNFVASILDGLVDLIQEHVVPLGFLVPVLLLEAEVVAVLQEDAALNAVVEDDLVDVSLSFQAALFP